jgi:hypothetical protein
MERPALAIPSIYYYSLRVLANSFAFLQQQQQREGQEPLVAR